MEGRAHIRWITAEWQLVTMPKFGNVLLRQARHDPNVVEIDLGSNYANHPTGRYRCLIKAAMRGIRLYVSKPYPRWYYHPPTMQQ